MISPASSTMNFMGRLQSNAPVSAAAIARNLSNLVPAPAFQPMKITASVFDMRHIAHRPLCTWVAKLNPECAMANILKGRRRAFPAVPHALGRTRTTDHRCGGSSSAKRRAHRVITTDDSDSWRRKFGEPIAVPDGGTLVTLARRRRLHHRASR
jgi:hypothetical protein